MNKIKKILFIVFLPFLIVWQLPQVVLGAITSIVFMPFLDKIVYHPKAPLAAILIFKKLPFSGVALWPFIMLKEEHYNDEIIEVEYQHCIQSLVFGPLYLILVGVPSVLQKKRNIMYGDLSEESDK